MLNEQERLQKITFDITHILQRTKERKNLFPFDWTTKQKLAECIEAIKHPRKGIFIKDDRRTSQSNYICVFVGESGSIIALPCFIGSSNIHWFTIKDVRNDENNPNWYIRSYNNIAKQNGLDKINLIIK